LAKTDIYPLDLNFQGHAHAIASYMLKHSGGVVLVESGPGSTVESLKAALAGHGYTLKEVTHVLLSHIHLDHAGAAGFLASQGAQVFVHPVGAPHMLNPEKLIASATRIYGDRMQTLWGDFLPVPADKLTILQDGEEVVVGDLRFVAINTPGHAEHHYVYQFEDLCFSGDVGAVRIPGYKYLRVPMPPPEFNLEKWRDSLARIRKVGFKRIAPTHFGIFDDVDWHLDAILSALDETERWMQSIMPADPSIEDLRQQFTEWSESQAVRLGVDAEVVEAYKLANPLGMSADGLQRYWKKVRMAPA
jgi:glyoxylase-like metal-dependent hydrolase (beta-lactamase superfamily II)